MLVVSDDVYDFLGNIGDKSALGEDGKLLPRLVTIERDILVKEGRLNGSGEEEAGVTVSNCSFSKLLGPGLRCGWIESATGVLARQMGEGGANHSVCSFCFRHSHFTHYHSGCDKNLTRNQGGAPSHFVSTLIYHLITTREIDTIINRLTSTYTGRSVAIKHAISAHLPDSTVICGGNGGFFMWIGLPPDYDVREIVKMAVEGVDGGGGVRVMDGDISECPGNGNRLGWGERWFRISVSWCDEEVAVEGVRRLGVAAGRWKKGERSKGVDLGEIK